MCNRLSQRSQNNTWYSTITMDWACIHEYHSNKWWLHLCYYRHNISAEIRSDQCITELDSDLSLNLWLCIIQALRANSVNANKTDKHILIVPYCWVPWCLKKATSHRVLWHEHIYIYIYIYIHIFENDKLNFINLYLWPSMKDGLICYVHYLSHHV